MSCTRDLSGAAHFELYMTGTCTGVWDQVLGFGDLNTDKTSSSFSSISIKLYKYTPLTWFPLTVVISQSPKHIYQNVKGQR